MTTLTKPVTTARRYGLLLATLFSLQLSAAAAPAQTDTRVNLLEFLRNPDVMKEGGTSDLVSVGPDGRLVYGRDEDGNRICDFSFAGYKGGGVAIPDVPVVLTVEPNDSGDDTARLQAAIDRVGQMPIQPEGFRGALLLKRGKYVIRNTLHLRNQGVVIRGEGAGFAGTWIYHLPPAPIPDPTPGQWVHFPQPDKGILPTFETHGGGVETAKVAQVTQQLVPAGDDVVTVDGTSRLAVGDEVMVVIRHTQAWVDALELEEYWKPEQFILRLPRIVKEIRPQARQVVFNVPINSRIDQERGYATAEVHKVTNDKRLHNIGIEDILFLSGYDRSRVDRGWFNDENHPNYVFRFHNARNGWLRRCVAFFYSSGMTATSASQHLTIEDCAMLDGVSRDTPMQHVGTRKYYYNAQGNWVLFQRCYGRYARHTFIGNGPTGGCVFLDCASDHDHLKSEWHQRWGHGHVYDNIFSEAQIGISGNHSGHGQKNAFALAWNNLIDNRRSWEIDLYINKLSPIVQNYAIGYVHRGSGKIGKEGLGEVGRVDSPGRFVEPRSIYLAQLRDRLGEQAVRAIATEKQISGKRGEVWTDHIDKFAGLSEYLDPDQAPWPGMEDWVAHFDSPAAK